MTLIFKRHTHLPAPGAAGRQNIRVSAAERLRYQERQAADIRLHRYQVNRGRLQVSRDLVVRYLRQIDPDLPIFVFIFGQSQHLRSATLWR